MNYQLAYRIGFHPWEDAESSPAFAGRLMELVAEEESEQAPPFGRALDIGTGSGIWGLALAHRGWEVTGIDLVASALERAEKRIAAEGAAMRVVLGDVTRLQDAGVGDGFRLIVDTGTFHDFDTDDQAAMGRGIDAVATDDATVILTVWPRRRRPFIRGADQDEIEAAFPGWAVTDVGPSGYVPPKLLDAVLRSSEHFYRLRRR
jgi:cyclopropane fatty-acyl-phospholipid synthase-like methyltransferase